MADQLESTFGTAILEEERQKAQQQGATVFNANVFRCYFAQCHLFPNGHVSPLDWSSNWRKFCCVILAQFQHQDTPISRVKLGAALSHQSAFEQGSHRVTHTALAFSLFPVRPTN